MLRCPKPQKMKSLEWKIKSRNRMYKVLSHVSVDISCLALVVTLSPKAEQAAAQPAAAESSRFFPSGTVLVAARVLSLPPKAHLRPPRHASRRFRFFFWLVDSQSLVHTHVVDGCGLSTRFGVQEKGEERSREGHMLLSLPTRSSLLNTTTTRRTTFCDAARSRVQHPASQTRRVPRVVLPTRRVVASGRELASRFVVARAEFDGNRGQEKARGGGDGDDSLVQVRSPHHAFPFSRCRSR